MKYAYLIVVLTFISVLYGKEKDTVFITYRDPDSNQKKYKTDTLIQKTSFTPNFIFETGWLPYTDNQMNCRGYGLYPSTINISECKPSREIKTTELINYVRTDSEIEVQWEIVDNCCYSFICDMEIVNDTILNLITQGYGTRCGCNCAYILTYNITINFLEPYRKENFKKLSYIILNTVQS